MPPKAGNSVNMRDVLAQPLPLIPAAVNALIRRPNEFDNSELASIVHEAGLAVLRAEEAASQGLPDTVGACLRLLNEAFTASDEWAKALAGAIRANQPAMETSIPALFRAVVAQRSIPRSHDAGVEVLLFIGNLCDAAETKEPIAELCMEGLAQVMIEATQSELAARNETAEEGESSSGIGNNFQATRAAATGLINAVKLSKLNKQRLKDWRFVARTLAISTDFFLQLQACEIIYRVSRLHKTLLDNLGDDLPPQTVEKIRMLPNDMTLLERMMDVVTHYNDLFRPKKDVLGFEAARVVAGDTTICEAPTRLFFAPCFVVIMLNSSADNVTVPYENIRSVHIVAPELKIQLVLETIPCKIFNLLQGKKDPSIIVQLAGKEQLAAFKSSPLREWVLRCKKLKAAATAAWSAKKPPQANPSTSSSSARKPPNGADGGLPPASGLETPSGKRPRSEELRTGTPLPLQRAAVGPSGPVAASSSRLPAEADLIEDARPQNSSVNTTTNTKKKLRGEGTRAALQNPMSPPDVKPAELAPPAARNASGVQNPVAAASAASSITTEDPNLTYAISSLLARSDNDIDSVINQLKSAIDAKIQKKREEAVASLNATVAEVQGLVDSAKAACKEERDKYTAAAEMELEGLTKGHDAVHEQVAEAVTSLNDSLSSIKMSHVAVKDQLQVIEIESYQAIEESRTTEQEFLRELKSNFEAQVLNLEAALAQRSLQNTSIEKISQLLSRSLDESV